MSAFHDAAQSMTDDELARAIALARNRRDAYAEGREPADVLAAVSALLAEQEGRRQARRARRESLASEHSGRTIAGELIGPYDTAAELGRELAEANVEAAREALTRGDWIKVEVGEDADDPVLILTLRDGMVMSEAVAGWSAGVVEPVCALGSDFLRTYLMGRRSVVICR